MLNTKFSPWPSFTEEEAEAVSRVLLSNKVNYWTGDEARDFEREYAEWTGTGYAIDREALAKELGFASASLAQRHAPRGLFPSRRASD